MSTLDFHGGKLALDTGVAGTSLILLEKNELLPALLIRSFSAVTQNIELPEIVTQKMQCYGSISD